HSWAWHSWAWHSWAHGVLAVHEVLDDAPDVSVIADVLRRPAARPPGMTRAAQSAGSTSANATSAGQV
ncbi:MAG TPA: hypothetical protein VK586_02645, partial [Streptosporangiaceae bacterium]|nr:hypothetical protein [Streptosporangiaceae bacterium]